MNDQVIVLPHMLCSQTSAREVSCTLTSPATRTIARLGTGAVARLRGLGDGRVTDLGKHDFSRVFLGVVDELAVIPHSGRNVDALDSDCSRPSSATT